MNFRDATHKWLLIGTSFASLIRIGITRKISSKQVYNRTFQIYVLNCFYWACIFYAYKKPASKLSPFTPAHQTFIVSEISRGYKSRIYPGNIQDIFGVGMLESIFFLFLFWCAWVVLDWMRLNVNFGRLTYNVYLLYIYVYTQCIFVVCVSNI